MKVTLQTRHHTVFNTAVPYEQIGNQEQNPITASLYIRTSQNLMALDLKLVNINPHRLLKLHLSQKSGNKYFFFLQSNYSIF